jgi:hypothetical protein
VHPIASDQIEFGAVSEPVDDPGRGAHELVVWTVSRIRDGRRYGVERDCHVVYAVTGDYFVEQTRKYRASAQQCIDLLLAGGHAGTTQRKLPLDGIMAVHSDPRTGRLMIKTLNGTHRLEPVGHDEADVLRQIATELVLRMPPGGAHFEPLDDAGPERRRPSPLPDEEERLALASLENARREDEPDSLPPPQFERRRPEPWAPHPESTPSPAASSDPGVQQVALPPDINVAGGVPIQFAPSGDPDPSPVRNRVGADVPSDDQRAEDSRASEGEAASPFMPRHRRTLLDRMEAHRAAAESHADVERQFEDEPDREGVGSPMTASSMLLAEQSHGEDAGTEVPAEAEVHRQVSSVGPPAGVGERRLNDDPDFPAVFNRRGVASPSTPFSGLPGWIPQVGEPRSDPASDPATSQAATEEVQRVEPMIEDPPVLAERPSAEDEFEESVGFNPDFDINQFR